NYWETVAGFVPPDGKWQKFRVDLTEPSQWVQIVGTGTFQSAVAATDRVLFRHDVPPLMQAPDPVAADFGLDRVEALPAPAPVPVAATTGRIALALLGVAFATAALRRRAAAAAG